MERRGDSWTAYGLWCVAGAGLALGVLSILTFGPFVLLVTLGLCGWLLWRVEFGWGMLGLLTGAGVPVLFAGSFVDTAWPSWLFVALAVGLAVAGLVSYLGYRRS
jgi:hypothetical protein